MSPEIRQPRRRLRLVASITAMLALLASAASAQQFLVTGSMSAPRVEYTATALNDGTVLIAGGLIGLSPTVHEKVVLNTAEIYDPATGAFHATAGTLNRERFGAAATLLNNGKVLIAGGWDFNCPEAGGSDCFLTSAELYDPVSGTFTQTGSLEDALYGHTATLMSDGTVLIVGGFNGIDSSIPTADAEIYDPATGTFSLVPAHLSIPRTMHTATLLNNGKVLIVGGEGASGLIATAELYDFAHQTFTNTGSLTTARWFHSATALLDGRVLVAGGFGSDVNGIVLSSAELYNPLTGAFDAGESLIDGRAEHAATRLSDGTVLVAGGLVQDVINNHSIARASAEIFDPNTGEFTRTASLNQARALPSATLLTSGQVLVLGGSNDTGDLTSAELYQAGTNPFALLAGNNTFSGNQIVNGNVMATNFFGNGAGLAGVNASMLGGLAVGRFARRDTSNLFNGDQSVSGRVTATSFFGDGSGLSNVAAASAAFASSAADSQMLGGIAANRYARLDIANAFTGNQAVSGNVSTTGTVAIGGGTPIVEHLSRAFTITVAAISPSNCNASSITINFPGASDGDTLALGIPNAMTSSGALTYFAWVSAANAVSFRVCNPRGPSNSPLTGLVRVDIWKH